MYRKCLILFISSLSLLSCIKEEPQTQAAFAPFNPDTTPINWSNASVTAGLNLKIATDITDDFSSGDDDSDGRNPIEQMMHIWNESTSVYDFFVEGDLRTANKTYSSLSSFKNDGEMGIYRADSWFSDVSSTALAITQTFGFRRNAGTSSEYVELIHADIIVNYDNFSFGINGSSTVFDLKTVILHELGHFLGLKHNDDTTSIMYPSLGRGEVKRSLNTTDISGIRSLYNASSLTAKSNAQKTGFASKVVNPGEGEEITTVIELRADGECVHYENGKVVHRHHHHD